MSVDYVLAPSVTLAAAQRAVAEAIAKAEDLAVDVCIAVTDGGGHLLAMARMDRAPLLCIHIAQDKAYSVASSIECTVAPSLLAARLNRPLPDPMSSTRRPTRSGTPSRSRKDCSAIAIRSSSSRARHRCQFSPNAKRRSVVAAVTAR